MADKPQVGRLAFRVEGDLWVAYYALPDTMHDALPLAFIAMTCVKRPERKEAFMDLMRNIVADIIEVRTGERPTMKTRPAPFWERKT